MAGPFRKVLLGEVREDDRPAGRQKLSLCGVPARHDKVSRKFSRKNHFSHRRSHVLIPNLGSPTENCRVRLGGLSIRSALRRCMNSTSLIDHFPFPALEPSATLPPATRSSGSCTQASARESAPSTTTSCVRSIANWCCRGD